MEKSEKGFLGVMGMGSISNWIMMNYQLSIVNSLNGVCELWIEYKELGNELFAKRITLDVMKNFSSSSNIKKIVNRKISQSLYGKILFYTILVVGF